MGLGVLLALLALTVGVISPPGFMVASRGKVPTVVICTGHGPEAFPGGSRSPDRSGEKGRHDGVCPFAGHVAAVSPALPWVAVILSFGRPAAAEATVADLTPGRGLAAPPPQSHAPPALT